MNNNKTPTAYELLSSINRDAADFKPSDKEKSLVSEVFQKFLTSKDDRDRQFAYFDNLNLIDYIEDSVRRFSTNIDERDGLEDWQSRVHDPVTRNKVMTILGKAVANLPIPVFSPEGDEDMRKASVLNSLYEKYDEIDDYEEFMTHMLLEAIVKGTAIGYDGVEKNTYARRDVEDFGDDIKVKEIQDEVITFKSSIVPLEDFYPSSVSIRNIKEMPYCFWRTTIPYSKFLQDWGMFTKSKYVAPKFGTDMQWETDKPYFLDFVSTDINDGNVEVIRFYNKHSDEYVILANGVWINPIKTQDGTEIVSPMPFNHKELPFFDIKFDLLGDWFYGKSMPDKLKSMQDVKNVLTNMLLDQSFLTIFPPLLTSGFDDIDDDYLRPGRRIAIDTQGQSISNSFHKLDMGVPSGWHQFILNYVQGVIEQASVDKVSSGAAGVGGRTTAQEIETAAKAVEQTLGIFAILVKSGIKRKAKLRAGNILQFISNSKQPILKRILGEDGNKEFNKAFNTIKINGTQLTKGKRGTKIIEVYSSKEDMPTKESLQAKETLNETQSGVPTEVVALLGSYIRNFIFDVKIVPNPKSDITKAMEKALQLEKIKVYMEVFPEMVDKEELFTQTAIKLGDDPSKIIKKQDSNSEQPQPGEAPAPQMNTSQAMMQSAAGGSTMNSLPRM